MNRERRFDIVQEKDTIRLLIDLHKSPATASASDVMTTRSRRRRSRSYGTEEVEEDVRVDEHTM